MEVRGARRGAARGAARGSARQSMTRHPSPVTHSSVLMTAFMYVKHSTWLDTLAIHWPLRCAGRLEGSRAGGAT